MLREQRTNLRPGARDNVDSLLRPLGNACAGHVAQIDIELQQPAFSNSAASSSTASCSGSLAGRTTTSRMTLLSKSTAKCSLKPLVLALLLRPWRMSLSSIEMRRSGATCCLSRRPPEPPPGSGSVSCVIICVMVSRPPSEAVARRPRSAAAPASVATVRPPPDQAQCAFPCAGLPPSRSSAALRLLCPTSVNPASSTTASVDVPSSWAARLTALCSAWPSRFNVSSTRPAPNRGVSPRPRAVAVPRSLRSSPPRRRSDPAASVQGVAEVDEQAITEILGNMAIKAGDHLGAGLLIGPHHLAQLFWVELAGEHGRVHQVTK